MILPMSGHAKYSNQHHSQAVRYPAEQQHQQHLFTVSAAGPEDSLGKGIAECNGPWVTVAEALGEVHCAAAQIGHVMRQALRGDAHLAGRQVVHLVTAPTLSSMSEVCKMIEPVFVQAQQLAQAALLWTEHL